MNLPDSKLKSVFVLFISVMSLFGCTTNKKTSQTEIAPQKDSLVAYLERTACFGRCPQYSIRIYQSGYVLYEGYNNVEKIGRYFTRLSEEDVKGIGKRALQLEYFNLNDEYRNPYLTDLPTVYTEVRFGAMHKKVTNYEAEPPPNLVEMEKYIDGLFSDQTSWQLHPVQEYKD